MVINFALSFLACGVAVWWVFVRRYGRGPRKYIIRKVGEYDFEYHPMDVKLPPVRGWALRILSNLINSFFGQVLAVHITRRQAGVEIFRTMKLPEHPTFHPVVPFKEDIAKPGEKSFTNEQLEELVKVDKRETGFKFHTVVDYVSLYKSGKLTPLQVAERALDAIQRINSLNAVVKYDPDEVRKSAAASTKRYKEGDILSPVDGIVVLIKDEYAVKGFTYSNGTSFLGRGEKADFDSEVVERLRQLGAVILAVANMHELGLGTTGNNTNVGFGICRNPYNVNHYSGGSSSGCASAIGAGLCVLGIGTDGGGSIRIPSAYCGVVGLKPTYARINLFKMNGLSDTVGHSGPLCTSVRDTALFYALLGGPHIGYEVGLRQPKIKLPNFKENLNGYRIGIDRRYFKDCEADVYAVCLKALDTLVDCGATVEDIQIPEIREVRLAHLIAILSEMTAGINYDFDFHFNDLTLASQIYFNMGSTISAVDYIQANKQRTRIMSFLRELFDDYDAIVTPTTGHCAPEIHPDEVCVGMLNARQDNFTMRYAGLGNLSGCPAISIPVGYNPNGLPVGLQFMSAWWREEVVLEIAEAVERHVHLRKPKIYVDLLDD